MRIDLKKVNASNHELKIIRPDKTFEKTILDTGTYLLHDICHFYVEKELKTLEGFWGMISNGYQINQLSGKANPLTEKLRMIENIVGGAQSVFSKHMSERDFWNSIQAFDYKLTGDKFLENVVSQINEFMDQWKYLPVGQTITLNFQSGNL